MSHQKADYKTKNSDKMNTNVPVGGGGWGAGVGTASHT